jgi:hypothetical protein
VAVLASPFKSNIRLEAENATLRRQLVVLRRQLKSRARLTNDDRWFFVQLYRWFPSILPALMIIRPETLVRWHRAGFRRYWRWKSNSRGGRPRIEIELRALIRQISTENQLWGAPRIHGELLKLGFRCRSINRRQVHGQATRTSRSGMADLSAKPRARHCRHGFVRYPDHSFSMPVHRSGCAASSALSPLPPVTTFSLNARAADRARSF